LKRILVFGLSHEKGGMEALIMNYYRALDKKNIQFDFVTYNYPPYCEQEIDALGGRCFVIPGRHKSYIANKLALNNIFKSHASEYCAIWYNCCMAIDITALIMARRFKIPVRIIHSHNSEPMMGTVSKILHNINKKNIYRYANKFWACSQNAADFMFNKKTEVTLINNAIDVTRYKYDENTRNEMRTSLGISSPDTFVCGHVGRFHYQKNHPFLIEIFAWIQKIRPDSILLLAGAGDDNTIRKLVEEKNLTQKVQFLGQRDDVEKVMQAMDAFILPSLFEGLPFVIIEAQCAGLPTYTGTEVVSKDAQLTPNLHFISTEKSAEEWAKEIILQSKNIKRTDSSEIIRQAGFDINSEVLKFPSLFNC